MRVLSEELGRERLPARVLGQPVEELDWVRVPVRVLDQVMAEDLGMVRALALYRGFVGPEWVADLG